MNSSCAYLHTVLSLHIVTHLQENKISKVQVKQVSKVFVKVKISFFGGGERMGTLLQGIEVYDKRTFY